MHTRTVAILVGVVALAAAVYGLLYVTGTALEFECGNVVLSEVKSPDGRFISTLFERNCGATTPFLRIVSLREASSAFDSERHDDWVFDVTGQPEVSMKWLNPAELSVTAMGGKEPKVRTAEWKDVAIRTQ